MRPWGTQKGRPAGRPFARSWRESVDPPWTGQPMKMMETTNSTSHSTTLVMMAFLWDS
jgi:hypothetical protein